MAEKCAICGATENIQKHHTSYEPEIIQLLCVDCHKAVHNHGVGKAPGWTTLFKGLKEDAEILYKEGATNREVAKACDISYATASHWRKKLGLGLPKAIKKLREKQNKNRNRSSGAVQLPISLSADIIAKLNKIAESNNAELIANGKEPTIRASTVAARIVREYLEKKEKH